MGYFDVPGWSYEQFFFEEFIPAVEKRYRIVGDKAHRAISGLSMGGGGTAVYALRHPEVFGSACPMSGLLDMLPRPRAATTTPSSSPSPTTRPWPCCAECPPNKLDGVRSVRWWVDCGDDDFLWKCNVDFYTLMRERDIPLQYRMRDGGHTWRYWQTVLPDALIIRFERDSANDDTEKGLPYGSPFSFQRYNTAANAAGSPGSPGQAAESAAASAPASAFSATRDFSFSR